MLPTQVSPPEFTLSDLAPSGVDGAAVVALPVLAGADGPELGPGAAEVAEALSLDLLDLLGVAGTDASTGAVGEVLDLPVAPTAGSTVARVLLVGVGAATTTDLRRAGATLARRTRDVAVVVSSVSAVGDDEGLAAFGEGVTLGSFGFSMRRDGPAHRPVGEVVLALTSSESEPRLARAVASARAGWTARLLAHVPSNIKSPQWLAEQAVAAAEAVGVRATVLDERQLADQGFGGIVGVGQGSAVPPRLVRLDYVPAGVSARAAKKLPHVVLVGKGITFDSGGLSIKPGAAMATMKRDMTGAGVVAAVLAALPAVDCPVRVTGLLTIAENAVGAAAMRPGDVIRHYGGRTTEVTNTDAEGRLVLADGLAYAVSELDADVLVDVATLTGGIKVALGQHTGGLFASDDGLAAQLEAAGDRSGEPVWRMPLARTYEGKLASKVADADNAPGGPAAITAALFLAPFTDGRPWAHLDIASVGDAPTDRYEWTEGPTGFGPRLLLSWLGQDAPLTGVV